MLSDRLKQQIKALQAIPDGILSDVEGMRQTVEDPNSLVLDPDNAMMHPHANLEAIGNSLNQFGFRKNAIAVKADTRIVYAGNGIVSYCIENEIPIVPVLWIPKEMTETEAKAFALADNQSAHLSHWDSELMVQTLEEIADTFSPTSLGFPDTQLNNIYEQLTHVDKALEAATGTSLTEPTSPTPPSGMVKVLFLPTELAIVETAIRLANKESRGQSLTTICQFFVEMHTHETETQ